MAHILVVDDEPLIAIAMAEWLADLGHEVVGPVGDLAAALALAETAIEAAILDISLGPDRTFAVARRLRERGVPYAVASGHDVENLDDAFAGAVRLAKPFGFESFRLAIELLLAKPGR